jgi:hypothetical protein
LRLDWQAEIEARLPCLDELPQRAVVEDAHEIFLAQSDFPVHADEQRAAGYLRALAAMRALAGQQQPLTWAHMVNVQQMVLGSSVTFRQTTAYAKGGREKYIHFAGLAEMFSHKVAQDFGEGCHPLVKAARLYLDLIFVHPFADGNARAARLWFEFGLNFYAAPLPDFADLVRFKKIAGSPKNYRAFVFHLYRSIVRRYEKIDQLAND